MKVTCLSVQNPWAELLAGMDPQRDKTIETRTWRDEYRGPLLICASKKPQDGIHRATDGKALVLVHLMDVRKMTPADAKAACCGWAPNLYAWVIRRLHRVEPFDVTGALGLFTREISKDQLQPMSVTPAQPTDALFGVSSDDRAAVGALSK